MRTIFVLLYLVCLTAGSGVAQTTDSLINFRPWVEAGNDHWYGVLPMELFWEEADSVAGLLVHGSDTGYLATITSFEEMRFVRDSVINGTNQPSVLDQFWLGGYFDVAFQWQTGEAFDYSNWSAGEPNNLPGESAMSMWGFNETGKIPGEWNNALPNDSINDLHQWWAVVEFGPVVPDTADTLINIVPWPSAEGGNDHTYAVLSLELFWEEADSLSNTFIIGDDTAYLATITSAEEDAFVLDNVLAGTNQQSILDQFWLGGYYRDSVWLWQSGEPFLYTNWSSGEPNNLENELALCMVGFNVTGQVPGTWNNSLPNDSVNDLHQWWALLEFGTDTATVNPADTLIDVRQWAIADGGNDHYYGIIPIVQPWVDHNALAPTLSYNGQAGYLATLRSQEEKEFVHSLLADHTDQPSVADEFYLGGFADTSGLWQLVTGETFVYADWASGEPSGDGDALAIWGMSQGFRAGQFNDVPEDTAGLGDIHQLWALVEFGPPDPPDSLFNLTRWPSAAGGNDHYYGVIPSALLQGEADSLAGMLVVASDTGYLATVNSEMENQFIIDSILQGAYQQGVQDEFWLGGVYVDTEWVWQTGEPLLYTNWAAGEPNNLPDESGMTMWGPRQAGVTAGTWNNEMPADSLDPMHRWWALVEFGPPDSGQGPTDTIINLVQWPDSAGGNNHWYGIIALEQFWEETDSLARTFVHNGDTGYLATITQLEESEFILDNVVAGTTQPSIEDEFWLGGYYTGTEFAWQTGEPFVYTNWASGEPNNLPVEAAMSMWGFNSSRTPGTWNNALPNDSIHDLHQWWGIIEFGQPESSSGPLRGVREWAAADGGNGHYYGVIALTQSWDEHKALADTLSYDTLGGYLATVRSAEEQAFIESLLADFSDQQGVIDQFFLGAEQTGYSWYWKTNELFSYANWEPGEPDDLEERLAIRGMTHGVNAGQWFSELSDTATAGNQPQYWAVWEAGPPDPVDTLLNMKQWSAGQGGNGHWYAVLALELFWEDADAVAAAFSRSGDHGHLATITSPEENQFVVDSILGTISQGSILNQYWLGGTYDGSEFGWQTAEVFNFTNWAPTEPNNLPDETAMGMWGINSGRPVGTWNNALPNDSIHPLHRWWAVVEFGSPPCCLNVTGNINGDPEGEINLTDLTMLISHLFVNSMPLTCPAAANTSGDIGCLISLTDVTLLVNSLFITFEPLAACNPACE